MVVRFGENSIVIVGAGNLPADLARLTLAACQLPEGGHPESGRGFPIELEPVPIIGEKGSESRVIRERSLQQPARMSEDFQNLPCRVRGGFPLFGNSKRMPVRLNHCPQGIAIPQQGNYFIGAGGRCIDLENTHGLRLLPEKQIHRFDALYLFLDERHRIRDGAGRIRSIDCRKEHHRQDDNYGHRCSRTEYPVSRVAAGLAPLRTFVSRFLAAGFAGRTFVENNLSRDFGRGRSHSIQPHDRADDFLHFKPLWRFRCLFLQPTRADPQTS